MEYRKWISNSKEVMQSVPKELRSTASELSIEASELTELPRTFN